ncbi:MAG: hypothetical protein MJ016_03980 [Victivallaceae bacterium]|nr:hypothetical protein [Victivallaceae bacterium]
MRYYTEDHEYVDVVGDEATVGISEYAVDLLGGVSALVLPDEEDDFIIGDGAGQIRGDGETMDLVAPISGTVSQINDQVLEDPSLLAESPEDKGWLFKMTDFDSSELDDMMSEEEYLKMVETD